MSGMTLPSTSGAVARRPDVRFDTRVALLTRDERRALFDRSTSSDPVIRARTGDIIGRVRRDGDAALRELALELDGAALTDLEVPRQQMEAALAGLPTDLRRALERAARNIATVHGAFRPVPSEVSPETGIVIGRRPDPLDVVGIYAPGGRAAYPSSVLMGAVPARVAGVREIILCTPPDSSGSPSSVVLATAALAGVDRVFAVGGAGAVAAMAYGTATIPRVDRIVGPGNAWVAEAKLQVAGAVSIDAPAGPSELLVIADSGADPEAIASELVAQAEHDPVACALAVVHPADGDDAAAARRAGDAILGAVERALGAQPRAAIVRASLATSGGVLLASDPTEAIAFANSYAPEHLLVVAAQADAIASRCRNAGTIFVGATSSNAFGDYMTGANHVLPTGGLARAYSGLSVLDFYRWTTWQRVDAEAAAALAVDVGVLADAEGLPGHAAAARARGRTPAGGVA